MPEKASMANLGDILRDVVQQFEGQAKQKNQQLNVSISCNLPPVRVMADQFKSVWVNLISNALQVHACRRQHQRSAHLP